MRVLASTSERTFVLSLYLRGRRKNFLFVSILNERETNIALKMHETYHAKGISGKTALGKWKLQGIWIMILDFN